MTHDEMLSLRKNDLVTVTKTGKVYRVANVQAPYSAERNAEIEANMAAKKAAGELYTGDVPGFVGSVWFIQQRNGQDYGPVRSLKPGNISRLAASAGYGDGGPQGAGERKIEAEQRPVSG